LFFIEIVYQIGDLGVAHCGHIVGFDLDHCHAALLGVDDGASM